MATLKSLGPFELEVYWYNRRILERFRRGGGPSKAVSPPCKGLGGWRYGFFETDFRVLPLRWSR